MAVTIRQIAAAAGVSRGTVDRVLHNRGGVKPEIAEHVRRIADEMGFLPNRAGKILAARKQPITIGCFLPSIGNAFFDDVIEGIHCAEEKLSDFGVSVLLREVQGYRVEEHIAAIDDLVEQGVSALCISTIDVPEIRAHVNRIIQKGIPVITVNTDLSKTQRLCYVGSDYLKGGKTAAGILSMMAPQGLSLLIVTGSLHIKGHNERIRGFSRSLKENGVSYHLVDVFESQDNDEHAYQTTYDILQKHREINCVYITGAGVAGVCRAICELGYEDRIITLAFDDIESTRELIRQGVIQVTICQEPLEQGYRAVQMMFDYFMSDKKAIPEDHFTDTVIKIKENID